MKKKNTIPKDFDDVLGNIYSNTMETEEVTLITDDYGFTDDPIDDEPNKEDKKEPPVTNTEDGSKGDEHEDDTEIPEEVLQNMQDDSKQVEEPTEEVTEPTQDDVNEALSVGLLFEAIGESLGWNMADIDEETKPMTVDDLTKFLTQTVIDNSVPHYADERIQQLDEYVKNGGKFEDFYQAQQQRESFDNIDMEDELNQKAVIKELMKYDGYSDEQINKRISRYEDADMLMEESEDALERLKTIRQREIEENAKLQQQYAQELEERAKAFYDEVTKEINSLTNIRGIAIPKEDRKALFDYIFKVDQDGLSQYQKDYDKNLSRNLIESAYFTMRADALISGAQKQGETSAAEKLRKMLRHSSKNHTVYNAGELKQKSVVDLATGLF